MTVAAQHDSGDVKRFRRNSTSANVTGLVDGTNYLITVHTVRNGVRSSLPATGILKLRKSNSLKIQKVDNGF